MITHIANCHTDHVMEANDIVKKERIDSFLLVEFFLSGI